MTFLLEKIQKYRKYLIAAASLLLLLFYWIVFRKMGISDNPVATSGWLYWGTGGFLVFLSCCCKSRNCRFGLAAIGILLLYPGLFCRNNIEGFFYSWLGLIVLNLLGIFWSRSKKMLFVVLCNLLPLLIFLAGVVIWYNVEYFGRITIESSNPFRQDPDLGYVHVENRKIRSTLYHYFDKVLSTQMTLDPRGRRITPDYPAGKEIIFIGCSFTEGVLLSDQDTLPYRIGNLSKRKVLNLGVRGYGIHQFQRMLELNHLWERQIPGDCTPSCIIYVGITSHVHRITRAGLPAYRLKNGRSVFGKRRKANSSSFFDFVSRGLKYNFLGVFLCGKLGNTLPHPSDIKLYTASVFQCGELLKKRYPNSKFIVLFHDDVQDDTTETILQLLQEKKLHVIRVSSLVKKTLSDPSYKIPYDGHPSALCWEEAAPELLKHINGKK